MTVLPKNRRRGIIKVDIIDLVLKNGAAFVLVLVRVGACFAALPVLSGRGTPIMVKTLVVVAMSFVLFPMIKMDHPVTESLSADPFLFAAGMLMELFLGMLIGLGARLIFAGVQTGAEMMGIQMGFGVANLFDPTLNEQVALIAQLQTLMAALIFFVVNGHHTLVRAAVHSFDLIPPLSFYPSGPVTSHLIRMGSEMFILGLKISIPVTVVLLLTNVALGILSRVVPQINVLFFSFPLTISIGLLMVGASLSLTAGLIENRVNALPVAIFDFMQGMAPRPTR